MRSSSEQKLYCFDYCVSLPFYLSVCLSVPVCLSVCQSVSLRLYDLPLSLLSSCWSDGKHLMALWWVWLQLNIEKVQMGLRNDCGSMWTAPEVQPPFWQLYCRSWEGIRQWLTLIKRWWRTFSWFNHCRNVNTRYDDRESFKNKIIKAIKFRNSNMCNSKKTFLRPYKNDE